MGRWIGGCEGDALLTSATALRSAFYLWLEDDDRAMVAIRTVTEMSARARAWRKKPARAAKIEAQGPRSSTRDWLEAAGWRRLRAFSTSLGEMSHATLDARWSGAKETLKELQGEAPEGIDSQQLIRGSALETAEQLFTVEVLQRARDHGDWLAGALEEVLGIDAAQAEDQLAERLAEIWSTRTSGLGQSDFKRQPSLLLTRGLRSKST